MVFVRRAIISATNSLSDRTRTIKNGNCRTARIRSRPALLPTRRLLLRRVQSDLRKARSPHEVPTRRPPDSPGKSIATLTPASDFTEVIGMMRPRISGPGAASAVYACPSACAGGTTPVRAQPEPGRAHATPRRAEESQPGISKRHERLKKRREAA